jgi:hypothetical protein
VIVPETPGRPDFDIKDREMRNNNMVFAAALLLGLAGGVWSWPATAAQETGEPAQVSQSASPRTEEAAPRQEKPGATQAQTIPASAERKAASGRSAPKSAGVAKKRATPRTAQRVRPRVYRVAAPAEWERPPYFLLSRVLLFMGVGY